MTWVQRFFTSFVSKETAANMKAHSEDWIMRCGCGRETSIWELGGIKYKAYGNSKTLLKCPACGKKSIQTLFQKSKEKRAK